MRWRDEANGGGLDEDTTHEAARTDLRDRCCGARRVATSAKDGDVLVRGACTKASSSKLKLSEEDGRIEVEFEVDENRNGVRWTIMLRRPSTVLVRTTRVTRGPSGSFELRRVVADLAGADRITARATALPARCVARPRRSDQRASESDTSSGKTIQTPSVSEIAITAKRRD